MVQVEGVMAIALGCISITIEKPIVVVFYPKENKYLDDK